MKVGGTIVTTTVEYTEADLGDIKDLQHSEVGELFMKIAMTLSPRSILGKSVQFSVIGPVTSPPSFTAAAENEDAALALALEQAFSFDTDAKEMAIFRAKLADVGLAITSNK